MEIEIYEEKTITIDYVEFKVKCDGEFYEFIVKWENDEYTFYYLDGRKPEDYPEFEYDILCRM